jgi:nucleotide-binding universal stress UspA family protein
MAHFNPLLLQNWREHAKMRDVSSDDELKITRSKAPYRLRRGEHDIPVPKPLENSPPKVTAAKPRETVHHFQPRLRRILIPVDFTQRMEVALQYAASLTPDHDGIATLFYVIAKFQNDEEANYLRKIAVQNLELMKKKYFPPETVVQILVRIGKPADTIIETAQNEEFDLIIMYTHARKGLAKVLLGSVAEKVIREAPCPVMVLKP